MSPLTAVHVLYAGLVSVSNCTLDLMLFSTRQ